MYIYICYNGYVFILQFRVLVDKYIRFILIMKTGLRVIISNNNFNITLCLVYMLWLIGIYTSRGILCILIVVNGRKTRS